MGRLGGLSRQRRGRPLNAEVNMINLVDVMLVLLIIFMVTAPILQGGIKVDLPKLDAAPVSLQEPVIITVQANGKISIGDKMVSEQALIVQVGMLANKHPGIYLRGDRAAPYGTVVRVLDILVKAGYDKTSLITQPATP